MAITSRYQLIAMCEKFPLQEAAQVINLAIAEKTHIDSGRDLIFRAVARQILAHKRANPEAVSWREVRRWAQVLSELFIVDSRNGKGKPLPARSIETMLQSLVTELIEAEEEDSFNG